jgi:hypothetical protein
MDTANQNKHRQLMYALILVLLGSIAYLNYRQQVFVLLASGTQWVLVTCGFVPEGGENIQSERLRKLYYAARMFNETPAKELSAKDRLAAERYPDMGFGLTHTFDTRPVSAVIGGWLFAIPCTYFIDSRDCNRTPGTARLKVGVADFEPISLATVEQFLLAASPEVIRITVSGIENWSDSRWQSTPLVEGYQRYNTVETDKNNDEFMCSDAALEKEMGTMSHCLLRFSYGKDIVVELIFASAHRPNLTGIRAQADRLVSSFQVRN